MLRFFIAGVLLSGVLAAEEETRQKDVRDGVRIVVAAFERKTDAIKAVDRLDKRLKSSAGEGVVVKLEQGKRKRLLVENIPSKEAASRLLEEIKAVYDSAYIAKLPRRTPLTLRIPVEKEFDETIGHKEILQAQSRQYVDTVAFKPDYSLWDMAVDVVTKDPDVEYRRYEYQATAEDITMAQAEFRPTLDVRGEIGRYNNETDTTKEIYTGREASVVLRQNLFNGFGSQAREAREIARAKAAFYKYKEVAQDKLYRAIEAYVTLLKYSEVLEIAKNNVIVHEQTLQKIQNKYEEGFSTLSQVERVKGRLALAKSNYISETNNYYDAKYNLHRAIGKLVDAKDITLPRFDAKLPDTLDAAMKTAMENNPSVVVARYNIRSARQAHKYAQKEFYPTLDVEAAQSWYDNRDGITGDERESSVRLIMEWNLYNGNADEAAKHKEMNNILKEQHLKNALKRETLEGLELSWSAYKLVAKQLEEQKRYRDLTERTLLAYEEEFELGRRTLLDLLDAQDELNNIKIQVLYSRYNLLFAKYRVLDAMGLLLEHFGINFEQNYIREPYPETEPDYDLDTRRNSMDQCDNADYLQGGENGCATDNRVTLVEVEYESVTTEENKLSAQEVETLWGADVPPESTPEQTVGEVYEFQLHFALDSAQLNAQAYRDIQAFYEHLQNSGNIYKKIEIAGHTDYLGNASYNQKLSQRRAKAVYDRLIELGADPELLEYRGYGEAKPVADNATPDGRAKNRRIEAVLYKR